MMEQSNNRFLLHISYESLRGSQIIDGKSTREQVISQRYPTIHHALLGLMNRPLEQFFQPSASYFNHTQYIQDALIMDLESGTALMKVKMRGLDNKIELHTPVFLDVAPGVLATYFSGLLGSQPEPMPQSNKTIPLLAYDQRYQLVYPTSSCYLFMTDITKNVLANDVGFDENIWAATFTGYKLDEVLPGATGNRYQSVHESHLYATQQQALAKLLLEPTKHFDENAASSQHQPKYFLRALLEHETDKIPAVEIAMIPISSSDQMQLNTRAGRYLLTTDGWHGVIDALQLPALESMKAIANSSELRLDFWNFTSPPMLRPTDTFERIIAPLQAANIAIEGAFCASVRKRPNVEAPEHLAPIVDIADIFKYCHTPHPIIALDHIFSYNTIQFDEKKSIEEDYSFYVMEASIHDAERKTLVTFQQWRGQDWAAVPGIYAGMHPDFFQHTALAHLGLQQVISTLGGDHSKQGELIFLPFATQIKDQLVPTNISLRFYQSVVSEKLANRLSLHPPIAAALTPAISPTDSHYLEIRWRDVASVDVADGKQIVFVKGYPEPEAAMKAQVTIANDLYRAGLQQQNGSPIYIAATAVYNTATGQKVIEKTAEQTGPGIMLEMDYDVTPAEKAAYQKMFIAGSGFVAPEQPESQVPTDQKKREQTKGDDSGKKPRL